MKELGNDLRLEINEYSDMSFSEFIKMKGGLIIDNSIEREELQHIDIIEDAPESIDWRKKGVVNPVKDQGKCGSCWTFSTIGSIESRWAIKSGHLLVLSEQELVDCDDTDLGCYGGFMDHAFKWLESHKLVSESDYPYKGETDSCSLDTSEGLVQLSGYKDIDKSDAGLINALQDGPISVGVLANDLWQSYSGGIVTIDDCPNGELNHGVVVVGYDANVYIVRNSWNSTWGESGYIRLSRKDNTCGIWNTASYPTF